MITAVLQARCSSRRLPRKVLADVLGRPMIGRQLERLARARSLERLVVATSTDASDDELAAFCEAEGVELYRGSLDDVLERVLAAGRGAEHLVRLTADCPLADPEVIDEVVRVHLEGGHDYTSNTEPRTYPDGLDVEVARMEALETAGREATHPAHREHVMPFLYLHPERFQLGRVTSEEDLSRFRWTVDEAPDLELVRAIYAALYPTKPDFGTRDIVDLFAARPELARINAGIVTHNKPSSLGAN